MEGLQSELGTETRRREEAELHVEEKDAELAGALARLGEYERVMLHVHVYTCSVLTCTCAYMQYTCRVSMVSMKLSRRSK